MRKIVWSLHSWAKKMGMKRDFLQSSTQGDGGISRYAIGEEKKGERWGRREERRGEEKWTITKVIEEMVRGQ